MKYLGEVMGVSLMVLFLLIMTNPEVTGQYFGRFVHGFQSAMTPVEPVNPAFAPERADQ